MLLFCWGEHRTLIAVHVITNGNLFAEFVFHKQNSFCLIILKRSSHFSLLFFTPYVKCPISQLVLSHKNSFLICSTIYGKRLLVAKVEKKEGQENGDSAEANGI